MFASRKQAVIECRQNIAPEKKDVRYVLYFLSWDRTERLLNLICCWDYILSVKAPLPTELTTFCLVFSSRTNPTSLQVSPREQCCSLTLQTLVCNSRNLWICWHVHEQDYISLWIVRGTKAKKNGRKWPSSAGLTLWWAGGEVVGLIKSWLSMRFP